LWIWIAFLAFALSYYHQDILPTMKIAALFLMLSLFFVSALDQKQDPTNSKTAVAEDEETYEDLENLYEDATQDNKRAKKNRDLGYYYGGGHGYGGGSSRYYSSYRSGGNYGHSYSYGSHSNYVRPTRVYPVVHDEPVVVHRYYNYYNRRSGKGMGSRK
jgi:hypothetical protein